MFMKKLREEAAAPRKGGWRLFRPILAGATFSDRLFACLGALAGVALVGAFCGLLLGAGIHAPLIVAPLGASAVLLFAVPSSPLAQPWSILGGNAVSALIGVLAGRLIPDPTLAIGLGVATAIGVMSLTRCLHPPGGALALTAALGGPAVEAWGFWFPLVPVALNSALLVVCGLAFHRLLGHRYPVAATPNPHLTGDPPAWRRGGFQEADVDAALTALDESFDIDRADLTRLVKGVEREAAKRLHGGLSCAEIMSRDVIRLREEAGVREARELLLKHNIRSLPVEDGEGRLVGTVGLRELAESEGAVGPRATRAITAFPQAPAMSLLSALTDGRTHAVIVTDSGRRILGVVTQTDLLGAAGGILARGRA